MKMFKFILFTTTLGAFTSCISLNDVVSRQYVEMDSLSTEKFNESYKNKAQLSEQNLWSILEKYTKKSYLKTSLRYIPDDATINLYFENKKTLLVSAFKNERLLEQMIIKGKIRKNKYFSLRRRFFMIPIPFLFFHNESKGILGIDKDKNLVLKDGHEEGIWLLIMANGFKQVDLHKYPKLKD